MMEVITVAQHQIMRQHTPRKITSILSSEPLIWVLVDNFVRQDEDPDLEFWWRATGFLFAILLHQAGYSFDRQCQNLLFYYHCVVSELGPGPDLQGIPRSWKSFMTDHFCPVGLSWEWGHSSDSPTIRFSFEPIGSEAGTVADPLNQYSVSRLVHQYQHILPQCDVRCFDHFSKELLSYNISGSEMGRITEPPGHESRAFTAFDFSTEGVMVRHTSSLVLEPQKQGNRPCPSSRKQFKVFQTPRHQDILVFLHS